MESRRKFDGTLNVFTATLLEHGQAFQSQPSMVRMTFDGDEWMQHLSQESFPAVSVTLGWDFASVLLGFVRRPTLRSCEDRQETFGL
jgi:hypothetical protein